MQFLFILIITFKYLRFTRKSNLYEFVCLPFGLSSAPRAFTKVMKPFVSTIRNKGIRLVIYLDYMLIVSSTRVKSPWKKQLLSFMFWREIQCWFPHRQLSWVLLYSGDDWFPSERKINWVLDQATCLRCKTLTPSSIREVAHPFILSSN